MRASPSSACAALSPSSLHIMCSPWPVCFNGWWCSCLPRLYHCPHWLYSLYGPSTAMAARRVTPCCIAGSMGARRAAPAISMCCNGVRAFNTHRCCSCYLVYYTTKELHHFHLTLTINYTKCLKTQNCPRLRCTCLYLNTDCKTEVTRAASRACKEEGHRKHDNGGTIHSRRGHYIVT